MVDRGRLEEIFGRSGCGDFKWIDPRDIVVARWVRMKCRFGCDDFGRSMSCPPHTPPVEECQRFFDEYTSAVLFHFTGRFDHAEDRHPWAREISERLLGIEREVFLAGHHKAFVMTIDECSRCPDCVEKPQDCPHPEAVRPNPEALAVDLFATVRAHGYPIEVLTDYSQAMNRYALLMIE